MTQKIQNFENFLFLCKLVTGQNFDSYPALERTERSVGGVMEHRQNLAL